MTEAIIVGIIAAIPASISAWATVRGNRKLETVHLQINSRMDALLLATAKENLAVGRVAGAEAERARNEQT
jgi:hypothetical protein